jgi:hypothetical protein
MSMSIVNKIIKTYFLKKMMDNKQIANVNFFIKNNTTNINEYFCLYNFGTPISKGLNEGTSK